MHPSQTRIGAILIGRNEGKRLLDGIASLAGQVGRIIYVDSGSTDGSVQAARAAGAEVVDLDLSTPFTAARARNAGLEALRAGSNIPQFVQFMDGDCLLQDSWLPAALAHLEAHSNIAIVCGRRRERFPEVSVYNWLIDREWNTQTGEAKACGGDALMRMEALDQIGGYNPGLIAGEEPEMCVRLRAAGWRVWRLDAEMTLHDAALTRFGQWWTRIRRGGHAFAEGASLHGAPPERHFVTETRRALIWGTALPVLIVLMALLISPWMLALVLIWPLQVLRLRRKGHPWAEAVFFTIGKFAESLGALEFYFNKARGRKAGLIEYK